MGIKEIFVTEFWKHTPPDYSELYKKKTVPCHLHVGVGVSETQKWKKKWVLKTDNIKKCCSFVQWFQHIMRLWPF